MRNQDIHIGCSSYYNHLWTEIFYPKDIGRDKRFDYYCLHFNTYELNSTFYKFPTVKSLQTWYNKAPENFTFSLKVPKQITHTKRLAECERELNDFYAACREGLADKLGCILFQLPPSFSFTEERLELVMNSVNPEFDNVVEFRHESWWRQEVYSALANSNINFCSVNYPKLPNQVIKTNAIGYFRFHGNPQLFYSLYNVEELQSVLQQFTEQDFDKAYVYFNNTASSAAIINALKVQDILQLKP